MKLHPRPITLSTANAFVDLLHRHHGPTVGQKFSIGAFRGESLVGVVIVSRPVARLTDRGRVAEVSRLCTDGTANACSLLYGAAARTARGMGYEEIQTFILGSESGASLLAAGWEEAGPSKGGAWSRTGRARGDEAPLEPKVKWRKRLNRWPIERSAAL